MVRFGLACLGGVGEAEKLLGVEAQDLFLVLPRQSQFITDDIHVLPGADGEGAVIRPEEDVVDAVDLDGMLDAGGMETHGIHVDILPGVFHGLLLVYRFLRKNLIVCL